MGMTRPRQGSVCARAFWLLLLAAGAALPCAQAQAELSFVPNPVAIKPAAAGDTVVVELHIDSHDEVAGIELGFSFAPGLLRITDIAEGPFLGRTGGTVANMSEIRGDTLLIVLATFGGDPEGVAGEGALVHLSLTAAGDDPSSQLSNLWCSARTMDNNPISSSVDDLVLIRSAYQPPMRAVLDLPRGHYALIALPVAFEEPRRLSDILSPRGNPGPHSWRGYGVAGGELTDDPLLSAGQAFWLTTATGDDSIRIDGITPPDSVVVALESGWNAIGWPWRSSPPSWSATGVVCGGDTLAWTAPQGAAVVDPHVYWWLDRSTNHVNDGDYDDAAITGPVSDTLGTGGFLVHAASPCTLLMREPSSQLPAHDFPPGKRDSHADDNRTESPEWLLELTLTAADHTARSVACGAWEGSLAGPDARDVLCPPRFFGGAHLTIVQEGSSWPHYKRAYASPEDPGFTWEVLARGERAAARLSWSGQDTVPRELHLYLVDPDTGLAVDMRGQPHFNCGLSPHGRRFLVEARTTPFEGDLLSPGSHDLRVVIPRVDPGTAVIDYHLPDASWVDLRVLDLAGRLVRRLDHGIKDPGTHRLLWRHDRGSVSSGIYFLHLRTPSFAGVRRMLVVR